MNLLPHEIDKLLIAQVGQKALQRLSSGIRLNVPEATALLSNQILEFARSGNYNVADLMSMGKKLLGLRQVIPGIEHIVDQVQVEATFPDGTKLVTIHNPICMQNGDFTLTFWGSFLHPPDINAFPSHREEGLIPGQFILLDSDIHINQGRLVDVISVLNTSDRPIQVGSHYHFIETNKALQFDRRRSYGKRLNIAAGTSIRFEPGESKLISLVDIGGKKIIRGGNGLCNGPVLTADADIDCLINTIIAKGFGHKPDDINVDGGYGNRNKLVSVQDGLHVSRKQYVDMYGPTTGDIIRLADSEIYVRVEKDYTVYGDECKFGGGKTLREGMGQATGYPTSQELDTVITNAIIIDSTGIFKADIGIKDGYIVGIGKSGNPDTMEGVWDSMIIGVNTDVIGGEGKIITAGGMDSHIHFVCPQICDVAISAGLTTLLGGGTGPSSGTTATTCTPGPFHIKMMFQATDQIPINFGFTGKGSTSDPQGLVDIIDAGAVGLKLHEDWGSTPAAIDCCLKVADEEDIQVTIHTDTLNESCCVEGSLAAIGKRTIHTYHSEGAGGGHAPDIITVCSHPNIIPSSTNPTRPLTRNTIDEHLDMLMVCHHLDAAIPEDLAFAESRIRKETIAAEDILHDIGAISIISSDSQAMGRVGEVITRTWQTADKMKRQRGQLKEDADADRLYDHHRNNSSFQTDNYRVRRYIAKYTINPCLAHGMSHVIGSVEVGKLADLALWKPSYFGVKPEIVIKGGHIARAQMGDANGSIPTPQPVYMRPMYASMGVAAASTSIAFISSRCHASRKATSYGINKRTLPVKGTRNIGKRDMILNDATPDIQVDPETYQVTVDGVVISCEAATCLPLAQRYFMF